MTSGQFDPRLVAYFGDPVLQSGFTPLPNLFLRHYTQLGLSTSQAMFVLQLMAMTWDLGSPPATLSQVAMRMGMTRRGVQLISAELHARGLVTIFDQYDTTGRQTENAFDLSSLFARLATFAPVAVPHGQQRERRSRPQPQATAPAMADGQTPGAAAPAGRQGRIGLPPRTNTAPPVGANSSSSSPGTSVHPPVEAGFAGPTNPASPLNRDVKKGSKNPARSPKDQQQRGGTAAAAHGDERGQREQERGGRSLRWDLPLTPRDVRQSRQVLARISLNADIADAVAPTLHPVELWALWLHARASNLRPAWIARQVFDPKRKCPRMAGIPAACEAAGRLLAALATDVAVAVLDVTIQSADRESAQTALAADPRTAGSDVAAAVAATWAAVEAERHGDSARHARPVPSVVAAADQGSPADGPEDPRWTAVKAALKATLPDPDYATWIAPLLLMHAEDDVAVIATPNVFVRTEIEGRYALVLQAALEQIWGRPVHIEVVTETAVAA